MEHYNKSFRKYTITFVNGVCNDMYFMVKISEVSMQGGAGLTQRVWRMGTEARVSPTLNYCVCTAVGEHDLPL